MKGIISVVATMVILSVVASATTGASENETPVSFTTVCKNDIESFSMSRVDVAALLREDSADLKQGMPLRFGFGHDVDINMMATGTWDTLPDGSRLCRLRLHCPEAVSINLLYSDFWLPDGAKLFIYNEEKSMVIGPFTSRDNKEHRNFATYPVRGDISILEYNEPADVTAEGAINIRRIIHGYRDFYRIVLKDGKRRDLGASGDCNINVNCPAGVSWHMQKKSVAYTVVGDGEYACSGSLVNNTSTPGTRYFLSANHCLAGSNTDDVSTWQFLFQYESLVCEVDVYPPEADCFWANGSNFRAATNTMGSDFILVEIINDVPDDAYYNGWNISNAAPDNAVCIHHPNDLKKISFTDDILSTDFCTEDYEVNGHYWKTVWNEGTIEPGSSGSSLFNEEHQIIGQLFGGDYGCDVVDPTDWFGKFGISWDDEGASDKQLKYWLDPGDASGGSLKGWHADYNYPAAIILIDRTNSMTTIPPGETKSRFEKAINLAKTEGVPDAFSIPDIRVAVMSFATTIDPEVSEIYVHLDFTDDQTAVEDAITNDIPAPGGWTPLARAMTDAADILYSAADESAKRYLYVYTDGNENASKHNWASPIGHECGASLGGGLVIDNWEGNHDCDPKIYCTGDLTSDINECFDYQCCLADKMAYNNITNVVYFGEGGPVSKSGQRTGTDEQNQLISLRNEIHVPVDADFAGRSRGMEDYYWLKYIADTSGGSFKLVCDVNIPPYFSDCPDEWITEDDNTFTATVVAIDPDSDVPVTYLLTDTSPAGASIDENTGVITWYIPADTEGEFELGVIATDICSGADTCNITIYVAEPFVVDIEKVHDAYQGHFIYVDLSITQSVLPMGGFDFLIAYDASALTFMEATPGQLLEDCGWEYFTYRHGVEGNCGDACPSGLLRIVAMAETNDSPNHPSCFGPPDSDSHELAEMKFLVTNDRTFECQYVPIRFFWDDCGDNSVSSVDGEVLYVSRFVYEFDGTDITDPTFGFPTYFGIQLECLNNPDPNKPSPFQLICFVNGGIDIICADSIDAKGDMNCNGIAYEIADAVTLANYFIYGTYAFTACIEAAPNPLQGIEAAIAASDCNNDGIVLTVADLVYLIRVITGDAPPDPKPAPIDAVYSINDGILSVNLEIAAAYLIIKGRTNPINLTKNMDMKTDYDAENNLTKVLIYGMEKNQTFSGSFLKFEGTLLEIEAATYDCATVKFTNDLLPTEFVLHQNRPNPFNPITGISFSLPVASEVTLEIFNINGQKVATAAQDHFEAGTHTVEWNGVAFASGVYLYKITAGDFTDTKKMLLLK